jgi:two-component system response regulator GlrR
MATVSSPPAIETETIELGREPGPAVRTFTLEVVEGAPPAATRITTGACALGSHSSNGLVVDDATVSRFHCELVADAKGLRVRDLGSRNGTILDGVRVHDAEPKDGSLLRLGRAVVRVGLTSESLPIKLSARRQFGGLVGESPTLRATFALLERAAATTATVLLDGETGTGKGAMAEAIHVESARKDKPFVVVDCAALSPTLLDSELFGHERGAFTGADRARAGAFEEADGGTVFLDEIGELPLELQPKLLRVLENREVRRVGQNTRRPIDVRLIAATNRDLRAEVNAGRFRADLYYRLAVVKITAPPLRARPDDLPALVRAMLTAMAATPEELAALTGPDVMARLAANAWPGNVRELRNYLERSLVLQGPAPLAGAGSTAAALAAPPTAALAIDPSVPYALARRRMLDGFERAYAEAVLAAHDGKVAAAARAAGIARFSFYRLLRRGDDDGEPSPAR